LQILELKQTLRFAKQDWDREVFTEASKGKFGDFVKCEDTNDRTDCTFELAGNESVGITFASDV